MLRDENLRTYLPLVGVVSKSTKCVEHNFHYKFG